jgi:DNA ligase-1
MPLAMNASPSLNPHGYWVSEKLDGVRARWDGQSLRTRSGRLIQAPASWLAPLLAMGPDLALDGELWMGRGRFEAVSAAVRRQRPDPAEWQIMRYGVFELPWGAPRFDQRLQQLRQLLPPDPKAWVAAIHQTEINSQEALARWLEAVIQQGGEGLILRAADAPYASGRSPQTWKLKPLDDAEATVIGHEPGRGRLAGLVGALRVRTDEGRVFKIGSGLSDARRKNPPAVGERITYRYRGFTGDGLPRFATYWRERPSEQ